MTAGVVPPTRRAILVTGGTGFVGSAVLRALLRNAPPGDLPDIRVLTRGSLPQWMVDAGVHELRGDLIEPATLRGICGGVGTLVHLATHIGADGERCAAVNAEGTVALLDEARRSAVRRVVNVSTTSVYGHGVHEGVSESIVAPNPASVTSRTRLAAERAVRAVGGIVLRPHLVYGSGDAWFVPTLLRLLQRVPAWIAGGHAMTSVIGVDDLAKVVAALARLPWEPSRGAVFHVNHPHPVSMRTLTSTLCKQLGMPLPEHNLPAVVHRALTERAMPELTDHQFSLLSEHHWYDSARIWRWAKVAPAASPLAGMAKATSWYRRQVTGLTAVPDTPART